MVRTDIAVPDPCQQIFSRFFFVNDIRFRL